jgi:hypothetical protein
MAKITHACGHEVDYKAVKDKAALTSRSCPACEHAARTVAPNGHKPYWVQRPLAGTTRVVSTPKGKDPVRSQVLDAKFGPRDERYYEGFGSIEEAEARIRQFVASGQLKLAEGDGQGPFEPWKPSPGDAPKMPRGAGGGPSDDDIRSLEGNEDIEYPYGHGGPEV